jgi:hypothetical protein
VARRARRQLVMARVRVSGRVMLRVRV